MASAKALFVNSMMYILQNPVMVPPGYKDYPTKEMMLKAFAYKSQNIKTIFESKRCGTMDIVIYLSCLSNIHNLSSTEKKIYFYCFADNYDLSIIIPDEKERGFCTKLELNEIDDMNQMQHTIFERNLKRIK